MKKYRVFSSLLSLYKWTEYFSKGNKAVSNPELLKVVQFCFAIPTCNGNIERVSLMQSQWIKERNRLSADSEEFALCSRIVRACLVKSFVLIFVVFLHLMKKIGSTEKYACTLVVTYLITVKVLVWKW
jgi:hypothetical protein